MKAIQSLDFRSHIWFYMIIRFFLYIVAYSLEKQCIPKKILSQNKLRLLRHRIF
jgi:hypothetical protein